MPRLSLSLSLPCSFLFACRPGLRAKLLGCAVLGLAGGAWGQTAPPAAPPAPAQAASSAASAASAARAAQAAGDNAQRRQQEENERQIRAERQAQDSQQAAQQQRRQQLCDTKKMLLKDARQAPEAAPDRLGVIERAEAAMTLACQPAR